MAQVSFKICEEIGLDPAGSKSVAKQPDVAEESAAGRFATWTGASILFGAAVTLL